MKIHWAILLILTITLSVQCGGDKINTAKYDAEDATTMLISANIDGAEGTAFLDKVQLSSNSILDNAEISNNGNFSFERPKGETGIYRLRVGTKSVMVLLSGNESVVNVKGDLSTLEKFAYTVEGSSESQVYNKVLKHFIDNPPQTQNDMVASLSTFVDTTQAALASMFICKQALDLTKPGFPNVDEILQIHKNASNKLVGKYGNAPFSQEYAAYLQQVQAYLSSQLVRVGSVPPDIDLPDPNGKNFKLSDLKGKIVLLDFWASWCRPCRMNNPHVVSMYNKYKDQGFTVYNVSLDGVDQRLKDRLTPEQLKQKEAEQRNRWTKAIKDDNLSWDYHVSDLKFWQCEPAKAYGVSSIPHTFLLDREGKIAAINPRGAVLENELKKLL